jgi:tight adherence protein C
MSPIALLGAGCGVGLLLVVRGARGRPADLAVVLRRLERTGRTAAEATRATVVDRLAGLIVGRLGSRVDRDLVVVGRTPERFAIEKVTTSVSLGAIIVGLDVVVTVVGAPLGGAFTFALAVCLLATGFVLPDLLLRQRADARRAAFRHALSSFLDLVNVLLAGGAGIETSLHAAADAGDGWAFEQLREALERARTMRQSPWRTLIDLGDRLGVGELTEIAASVQLAGEQGARVKLSLNAKAAALRARQMARVEADAHAATERMGLPTVLMFLGFMVLLGYPAMQQISGAL